MERCQRHIIELTKKKVHHDLVQNSDQMHFVNALSDKFLHVTMPQFFEKTAQAAVKANLARFRLPDLHQFLWAFIISGIGTKLINAPVRGDRTTRGNHSVMSTASSALSSLGSGSRYYPGGYGGHSLGGGSLSGANVGSHNISENSANVPSLFPGIAALFEGAQSVFLEGAAKQAPGVITQILGLYVGKCGSASDTRGSASTLSTFRPSDRSSSATQVRLNWLSFSRLFHCTNFLECFCVFWPIGSLPN